MKKRGVFFYFIDFAVATELFLTSPCCDVVLLETWYSLPGLCDG